MQYAPVERQMAAGATHQQRRIHLAVMADYDPESAALFQRICAIIDAACAKGSTRELRLIARELDAATLALPPHRREGLEALLPARSRESPSRSRRRSR